MEFSNWSTFLWYKAYTFGCRWNTSAQRRVSGFLGLKQGYHEAEKLQRGFSKKSSLGKNVATFIGEKNGFKYCLLFLWKMVKSFRENHKILCFYWNHKNWLIFFKEQFLLRAELSSLKGSTFLLFLKYLLRAPWKVFLLAWLSRAQASWSSTQKHIFCAQTLPSGDVFMLRSPDTGLPLPKSPGRHGAHEAG